MKNIILACLLVSLLQFSLVAQELSPYIKAGTSISSIQQVSDEITKALKDNSFTILGSYNPEGKSKFKVIAFTRNDLKNTVIKVKDRGALAAVMKIGLINKDGKVIITYTNPEYLLRAYLPKNYNTYKNVFDTFNNDLKEALSSFGSDFTAFGGTVESDELPKYHYKITMPYFTDPIKLGDYNSFEQGLAIIEKNLKEKKGHTVQVYKLIYSKEKVAVFGIGLEDKETGESYFLPKIGEDHIAAMPYEIILQGNEVTMLHGKYRIALHWPDLTMGTFMKIMSTPGDIEDTLESLCE